MKLQYPALCYISLTVNIVHLCMIADAYRSKVKLFEHCLYCLYPCLTQVMYDST